MTLPDLSEANLLKSQLFKDLLKKDLLFNIYKDGKWGSYRHLPLDTGKARFFLLVDLQTLLL